MMRTATGLLSAALCVWAWAAPAAANPWNERTILKFDAPVMVPGATLPAGTYIFQIADATNARHTIRITRESDSQVIASVQAVPMRREKATDDIVIKFNPTERGAAPAVKGWFYPGREYGHEFIYPEDQARDIASRTHTLVLAEDAKAPDMSGKGTLHVIDAQGQRNEWKLDETLDREWNDSSRSRQSSATASSNVAGPAAAARSCAASIQSAAHPAIGDLVALASGDDDLVGRPVHLDGVEVTGVDAGRGFFAGPRERQLFVLTQYAGHRGSVERGQKVSVDGFVMQMPGGMPSDLTAPGALNKHIYVYATDLK